MISVVTCSVDPQRYRRMRDSLQAAMGRWPVEFVLIDDARSLAEGYNRGLDRAQYDRVVFCHDDIEALDADLDARIVSALESFDVIGVAGSDRAVGGRWHMAGPPHLFGQVAHVHPQGVYQLEIYGAPMPRVPNIQVMDGVFLAANRARLGPVRFDAGAFDGFHLYDLDFTFAACQAGLRLGVCNDIRLIHHSFGDFDQRHAHFQQKFEVKWAAKLAPREPRQFHLAVVVVRTREELLRLMNPPYWHYR